MRNYGETTCRHCGKVFTKTAPTVAYCSEKCRKTAWQALSAAAHAELMPESLKKRAEVVKKRNKVFFEEVESYDKSGLSYGRAKAPVVEISAPKWVKGRHL